MHLTDDELAVLDGKAGEAARLAMSVMRDMGAAFGAERLIPVSQVHIDTTLYMVDAGVEFAEKMAAMGGRFTVPTSLNPSAIDLIHWQEYRTPPDLLENSRRIETAYLKMGAAPTWTCTPYQHGLIPRFGEQIAWGESNAIAFANSVLGARTNRYADLMDICAAIIGKVPEFGLHLAENRRAEILIRLVDLPNHCFDNTAIYPVLGYLLGEIAGDAIAAIQGIPRRISNSGLKAFCAAAATSGAVGLFHMIGITPEAQSLEMCFHGRQPEQVVDIDHHRIQAAAEKLSDSTVSTVDLIALGCPHYSFQEFRDLIRLLNGRKISGSVVFWVFTNRSVYAWIRDCGMLNRLSDSGIMVFTDG
ncbi:MAG TPA: aconitase X catalytic domain-containing protein, partial [Desulfatirhabdiaceae bacterium]|nr:aconitase X catalytic domain-containing protein [Desulfatirhabdiaceae bacterium]